MYDNSLDVGRMITFGGNTREQCNSPSIYVNLKLSITGLKIYVFRNHLVGTF